MASAQYPSSLQVANGDCTDDVTATRLESQERGRLTDSSETTSKSSLSFLFPSKPELTGADWSVLLLPLAASCLSNPAQLRRDTVRRENPIGENGDWE